MPEPVAPVPSPCRRECTLDDNDVCLGCGRTLLEITGWTSFSEEQRVQVVESAARRREEYRRRFPWAYR
jgi:predicted Fe-S protein YdhL (DUF1289 family)